MVQPMTSEQKKAFLLLKLIIFSYHGLDEEEKKLLRDTSEKLDGKEELKWVEEFFNSNPLDSFDRAREYFNNTIATYDSATRLTYLNAVWESTNTKGYISEMEAMAILKLAKDWGVQRELLNLVRK
jgi:hypothetical protein